MTIKKVGDHKFDFQELSFEDWCAVQEKVPSLIAAISGAPLPEGTLTFVSQKMFKFCLVDGKEMGKIEDFFVGEMRPLYYRAILAAAEVNFPDFFANMKKLLASNSNLTNAIAAMTTSSQATESEQQPSSQSQSISA